MGCVGWVRRESADEENNKKGWIAERIKHDLENKNKNEIIKEKKKNCCICTCGVELEECVCVRMKKFVCCLCGLSLEGKRTDKTTVSKFLG